MTDEPETPAGTPDDRPDEGPIPEPPRAETSLAELREAVGVAPARRPEPAPAPDAEPDAETDLDDEEPARPRRWPLVVAIAGVIGLFVAGLVLLGISNASRYVLTCGDDRITAERGRGFPPWGTRPLEGAEWRSIAIPPGLECESVELDDVEDLRDLFLAALRTKIETQLVGGDLADVDQAERELQQALLLARAPERRDVRKEIERLLGDVEYWRGAAQVKAAIAALEEAGRRFDAAAERRPRHVSDAAAWAGWVREVAAGLAGGPTGATRGGVTEPPPVDRPQAPPGVALPVEEPPPPEVDAGSITAPVDAGVPRGGVLL